jgi:dGTPase
VGHAGERRLDLLLRPLGGRFDHNLHALRIVEQFEQRYLDFPGLNLTFEVREGIIKHSRDFSAGDTDSAEFRDLAEYELGLRPPIEAQLMDAVDSIAYNIADIDDGFEAHLLDVPMMQDELPVFAEAYAAVERTHPQARDQLKFNAAIRHILDLLATDLIQHTRSEVLASGARDLDEIRHAPRRFAGFSPAAAQLNVALKRFLYKRLYDNPVIVEERDRSVDALEFLFRHYLAHPDTLPPYYTRQAQREPVHRVVCDYIAGMTDDFMLRQYRSLVETPRA